MALRDVAGIRFRLPSAQSLPADEVLKKSRSAAPLNHNGVGDSGRQPSWINPVARLWDKVVPSVPVCMQHPIIEVRPIGDLRSTICWAEIRLRPAIRERVLVTISSGWRRT